MFTNTTSHKQMTQIITIALCVFLFVGMFMLATTTSAFCTNSDVGNDITTAVSDITKEIYNIMRAVIVPCCIVALGFAGFQFIFGGSQGAEKARKVVFASGAAIGFVIFAPMVIKTIAKMVSDSGTTDKWNDYNVLDGTKSA